MAGIWQYFADFGLENYEYLATLPSDNLKEKTVSLNSFIFYLTQVWNYNSLAVFFKCDFEDYVCVEFQWFEPHFVFQNVVLNTPLFEGDLVADNMAPRHH